MLVVNEFEATIRSLGENVVSYIGRDNLEAVTIWSDEVSATADISIVLLNQAWDAEARAIDKMIEIREMFLDDLAIDYRFDSDVTRSRMGSTKAAMLQVA